MTIANITISNTAYLTSDLVNTTNTIINVLNAVTSNTTLQTEIDSIANNYATNTYVNSLNSTTNTAVTAALATKLNSSSYTATDVIAKLLTVDGIGSGLDADLFEGSNASFYLNSTNQNSGTLPNGRLSGSYTGIVAITASANVTGNNIIATFNVGANTFSGNGQALTSVNAAFFNGQLPSYYTDIVSRLGYTPLNTTAYTAGDVLTKVTTFITGGLSANATNLYVLANSGISANSTGVFAVSANGITITSAGINAVANNGLVSNTSGLFVIGANGAIVTNAGVNVKANTGIVANTSGVFADIATSAQYLANTASKILSTDQIWAAAVPVALTPGSSITLDLSTGINFSLTINQASTLTNASNAKVGQSGTIYVTQDGTGSRTLAYGTFYKFSGGVAPVLSLPAGTVDRLTYFVRAAGIIDIDISKARA